MRAPESLQPQKCVYIQPPSRAHILYIGVYSPPPNPNRRSADGGLGRLVVPADQVGVP